MPYSDRATQGPMLAFVRAVAHGRTLRVLDCGMGAGSIGRALKDSGVKCELTGLERFAPYVIDETYRKRMAEHPEWGLHHGLYERIVAGEPGDFVAFIKQSEPNEYDLIIFGDSLEHVEQPDATRTLVSAMEKAAIGVIVNAPIVEWPQGALWGNPYEAHRFHWNKEKWVELGGTYIGGNDKVGCFVWSKDQAALDEVRNATSPADGAALDMPLLSFALINKSDGDKLVRLVESLKGTDGQPVYDQFVVVDTGSTDNSVEVAARLGAEVYECGDRFLVEADPALCRRVQAVLDYMPPSRVNEVLGACGAKVMDFAAARNYALAACTGQWVLMIDSDEEFLPGEAAKLRPLLSAIDPSINMLALWFVFARDAQGRPLIEFFRHVVWRNGHYEFKGRIHEVPVPTGGHGWNVRQCPNICHAHQQYDRTGRGQDKGRADLAALKLDVTDNPNDHRKLFYIAREYYYKHMWGEAYGAFEQYLHAIGETVERSQAYIWMAECAENMGWSCTQITDLYEQAINLTPLRREPYVGMGLCWWRNAKRTNGRESWRRAVVWLEAALAIPDYQKHYLNMASYYREVPHDYLYVAYYWLGQKDESLAHLKKAMTYVCDERYVSDLKQFFGLALEDVVGAKRTV